MTCACFFCCDDYHAFGCACSVDSSCRGIFQYVDGLDIIGIDFAQVVAHHHTVYHVNGTSALGDRINAPDADSSTRARLEAQIPLRRLGTPEDCARVVEFLVTELSDYVTGQCIPVCGGFVAF